MTRLKSGLGIAVVALLAAGSAGAQTAGQTGAVTTTTGSTSTTTAPGSFQSLSPGNQKIAQALFEAQTTPTATTGTGGTTGTTGTGGTTATGPTPLTLDQIAALKGTTGWGHVFTQMRAQGLVQQKNLGQVVSGYEHQTHAADGKADGDKVVVTNGSGRSSTLAATGNGAHQGDGLGGKHGDPSTDGSDMVVTTAGGTSASGTGVAGSSASAHGDGLSHGSGHSK
jgi:hypothetical protein